MAASSLFSLLLLLLLLLLVSLIPLTFSQNPPALVLPISKHALTLQYTTTVFQRTPLVPINVAVDLSGPFLWVTCGSTHNSSTYRSPPCPSPLCSLALPTKRCNPRNKCTVSSQNVFTSKLSSAELSQDVLSLNSTNGVFPTSAVSAPQFLFLCAPDSQSEGLARGAQGVAGLGHGRLGLPAQLAAAFNLTKKFAMCLSPQSNTAGVMFFGDGPYVLLPGIDMSKLLIFTPLITRSHIDQPSHSFEYLIRVKSIRVNGKKVPLGLNSSLLTEISTVNPYTMMETSLYDVVTKVFTEEAMAANVTRVARVAPFQFCFNARTKTSANLGLTRPAMPIVDLVLQDERVFWRIFETNSMVSVGNDTTCLGFLDGGKNMRSSIILGGYQIEDNLLQFDLVSSRLGFTSSLLLLQSNCGRFEFKAMRGLID